MSVIENFALLSEQEQRDFAEALVKTLNTEKTFADFDFKVDSVEADDMTGGLTIELSHEDLIDITRNATWQCGDAEEAEDTPDDAEFENYIWEDAKQAFKTFKADLEGYTIELEISDADKEEIVDVDAEHVSHEDSGIGHYEYWGHVGYDSHPYCEVEGTITQACSIYFSIYVEAKNAEPVDSEEEV